MLLSEQVFTYPKTFSILSEPLMVVFNYSDFGVFAKLLHTCGLMTKRQIGCKFDVTIMTIPTYIKRLYGKTACFDDFNGQKQSNDSLFFVVAKVILIVTY
jgi:hypothetical protein